MLNVSSGFKSSVKQLVVVSDGKVDIVNSNRTLSFNSDSLSKIELYGSAFQNDKVLGNLAQHSLTIEILGDLTKDISLNLENVVKPYIGVKVGASFEYVQYQDFLITEITYSDTTNITKILATDSLVKLNKEYTDTNIYPLTLKAYLENVLASCGLSLENTTFFNDDFIIDVQAIPNLTLARDIVSKVAELALCFVSVNKVSNKVELKKAFDPFTRGYTHGELSAFTHEELSQYTHYELSHAITLQDESVDKQNYWNFKLSDHWFGNYGINTLTLKISQVEGESNSAQDTAYVGADGVVELSISDNPFINTEALRLSVIDAMLDEVLGYKYAPYSLEYIGFPYLEVGDIVDITRMDGATFGSPIYELNLRYDGGLYGKLVAKALSKTETKYYNTQTLSQRTKNAEIIVDKLQGEVTIMAGDYYDGKLSGAKYVFDGTNATFYGGGLKIKNNALEDVFYADVNGNLTLSGTINANNGNIGLWQIIGGNLQTNDNKIILDANNGKIVIDGYTIDSSMIIPPFGTIPIRSLVFDGGLYMYFNANVTAYSIDTWAIHNCDYINPIGTGSGSAVSRVGLYNYPYNYGYFKNLTLLDGGILYKLTRDSNGFVKATSLAENT